MWSVGRGNEFRGRAHRSGRIHQGLIGAIVLAAVCAFFLPWSRDAKPDSQALARDELDIAQGQDRARIDGAPVSGRTPADRNPAPGVAVSKSLTLNLELHDPRGETSDGQQVTWQVEQPRRDGARPRRVGTFARADAWDLVGTRVVIALESEDPLHVVEIRSGNRLAVPRQPIVDVSGLDSVTIEADLPQDGGVRILDARSGVDLRDVWVLPDVCIPASLAWPSLVDENSACLIRADSPLRLPANVVHQGYWVGAKDHAWRHVQFGAGSGYPVYALQPGGDIVVDIDGDPDIAKDCSLRIERPTDGAAQAGTLLQVALGSRNSTALSGVPLGEFTGRLVKARGDGVEVVLAEQKAVVNSGAPARLVFRMEGDWSGNAAGGMSLRFGFAEPTDAVALEARITGPGSAENVLASRSLERMTVVAGTQRHWRVMDVPPGKWTLSVVPTEVRFEVEVQASKYSSAEVQIPRLPRLRVWTVDLASGDPVHPSMASWQVDGRFGRLRRFWMNPQFTNGALELPVVHGENLITVGATGFVSHVVPSTITTESSEILVELERSDPRTIHVALSWGPHAVPAPESTWTQTSVRGPSGESSLLRVGIPDAENSSGLPTEGASAQLIVHGPGPHTIDLGPVPGYRSPGPLTLESNQTELGIALVPDGPR